MSTMSTLFQNTHRLFRFLSYTAITFWFILIVFIIPLFQVLDWVYREPHDTRMHQLALRRLDHMRRVGNYSEEVLGWMDDVLGRGG